MSITKVYLTVTRQPRFLITQYLIILLDKYNKNIYSQIIISPIMTPPLQSQSRDRVKETTDNYNLPST